MGQDVCVIRPFLPEDIVPASELEDAIQPRPWTAGTFRDELGAPGRIYLVAEDGGLVGFAGVMVVGDEAHVTTLLVAPSRRGEGVGRRLLTDLIRSSVEAGASHLTLEVRSGNEAARSLYASVGLAPVGIRPGYYGHDDALIMWAHDIDDDEYLERLK